MQKRIDWEHGEGRRGIALVPTMLVISGLAVFAMALVTTVLSGQRTVVHQDDDNRLSTAAESAAVLAAEALWSDYIASQGGAAGDIVNFRLFLTGEGIEHDDTYDPLNPDAPGAHEGLDLLERSGIPVHRGETVLNGVHIDALRIVRRDVGDSTQLFLTTSVSTDRGDNLVNPLLNRAIQQVYTVEPADFDGFDYAMLANNVNCIFCHTSVDSVKRYYNTDSDNFGSFDRVRVGTLESLMVRHNMDGKSAVFNDYDSDSYIAGTLYSRGPAMLHDGSPIADWNPLTFRGFDFDGDGLIAQDPWDGSMSHTPFSPAGDPPGTLENLYLNYSDNYAEMVDGPLPTSFPAPIPDDGGRDPLTGMPVPSARGNKQVDDVEFDSLATKALGSITGGVVNLTDPGDSIQTLDDFRDAFFEGNQDSLQKSVSGNVILNGSEDPIVIDGTVAIDGDLFITGQVRGQGTLIVRGNIYLPSDLQYADGRMYQDGDLPGEPTGPRTFGLDENLKTNALGLTAGGNIMIGDFLRPVRGQPDGTSADPAPLQSATGDVDGDWSFVLAEISLFNRGEWAKTQPMLPGSPGEANQDPSTWTAVNPDYDPDYLPRYYMHGEGDTIPIHNRGNLYYDPDGRTWITPHDEEVPTYWNSAEYELDWLTYADADDPNDPLLFAADGSAKAALATAEPTDNWLKTSLLKKANVYFENNKTDGEPLFLDGLIYTNNAIFAQVSRFSKMKGQVLMNGSLVAADLGMLAPGFKDDDETSPNHSPISRYAIGLQLNYDERVKSLLNVRNPFQVQLKRTLWNPTANVL